jgi:hypothetical protein
MLMLNRLDQHDRTALVEQIAGGKALPDQVINQIADRTDGVLLFVEELTKTVLECGLLRDEGDITCSMGWCKWHGPIGYAGGLNKPRSAMAKLKTVEELFKGRHFDRRIVILCVRWYLRF